ncbi:hypothetical protein [Neisseria elongata]|uniref:hypothetical protein n=1 Tax=Neisseria elongata TaxID=495 RepID=UPI00131DA108|nr:hypothetical protein [Neisseria elongata]
MPCLTVAMASYCSASRVKNAASLSLVWSTAWAALQVFYQEPLDGNLGGRASVDIY